MESVPAPSEVLRSSAPLDEVDAVVQRDVVDRVERLLYVGGDRVWIGSSFVRFVGYIISWIPLGLGFLMAAFQKQKLALHDLIAGTEVVYGDPLEEGADVDYESTIEIKQLGPAPLPAGFDDAEVRPSRVPEILIGTGLLLIVGAMALSYMR